MVEEAYSSLTIIKVDCSAKFEHVNTALKYDENMPRIMYANSFAVFAQISIAICTSEPFSMDRLDASITNRSGVHYSCEVLFEILSITIPIAVLTSRNVVDWNEERKGRLDRAVHRPRDLDKDMRRIVDCKRDFFAIGTQII